VTLALQNNIQRVQPAFPQLAHRGVSDLGPIADILVDLRKTTARDWFELATQRLLTAADAQDRGNASEAVMHSVDAFQMVTIGRFVYDGILLDMKSILLGQLPTQEAYELLLKFLQVINKKDSAEKALAFTFRPSEFFTADDARLAISFASSAFRLLASDVDQTIDVDAALRSRVRIEAK
jgi:hypothetical protein